MSLSREEQNQAWNLWRARIEELRKDDSVDQSELKFLKTLFLKPNIIGNGKDMIRPDELGKLDVFDALEEPYKNKDISLDTRFKFSGISGVEELLALRELNDNGRRRNNYCETLAL